jgi:hypothetical protein
MRILPLLAGLGDKSRFMLWIALFLLLIGALAAAFAIFLGKKRSDEDNDESGTKNTASDPGDSSD